MLSGQMILGHFLQTPAVSSMCAAGWKGYALSPALPLNVKLPSSCIVRAAKCAF